MVTKMKETIFSDSLHPITNHFKQMKESEGIQGVSDAESDVR